MRIEEREALVRELLNSVFMHSVGFGNPEILLRDLERCEQGLVRYEASLKSKAYKDRALAMLESITPNIPAIRIKAERQRRERELSAERRRSRNYEPRVRRTKDMMVQPVPERRIPIKIGLNEAVKRHAPKLPRVARR